MRIETAISCLKKRVSYPLGHKDLLQLWNKIQFNITENFIFCSKSYRTWLALFFFFNIKSGSDCT